MKEFLLDLHIHSVLSPCANILMTPKNIINQAIKNGIDIISITDHNSDLNIKSTLEIAKNKDIIIIPGIEVQSKEEIHLLSYFMDSSDLKKYAKEVYNSLGNIKNKEDIFGFQIIVDKYDKFIDKEEKLLTNSSSFSVEKLIRLTRKFNGIPIPSHADRSYGIINNLGFIPKEYELDYIEMNFNKNIQNYYKEFPYLKNYTLIRNSDSHYLNQIKPMMKLNLSKNPTFEEIFKSLRSSDNKKILIKE